VACWKQAIPFCGLAERGERVTSKLLLRRLQGVW